MARYNQNRLSYAGSLLEEVMMVWESYVNDRNTPMNYGAPFDGLRTDEGPRSLATTTTESRSADLVSFSRKGVNFSRKLNIPAGFDILNDPTHAHLGCSQERVASRQIIEDDSEPLQEGTNETHSALLTRQASKPISLLRSKLYATVNHLKGAIRQMCHSSSRREEGHRIEKAPTNTLSDYRAIEPHTRASVQRLPYMTNVTQVPCDDKQPIEAKIDPRGRCITHSSEIREDILDMTASRESCCSQDSISVNINDAGRWTLRGGGGTLFNLAALRDKYRNGRKPQVKMPAPELESSEPVVHTRQQPGDAFTGVWNGHYQTASEIPDEVPLNSLHWWLSGGRSGRNSRPQTVGDLREMRKASDKVKDRVGDKSSGNKGIKPRTFWNEFGYTLTGGRYGSGRNSAGSSRVEDQDRETSQPVYTRRAEPEPSASRPSRPASRSYDNASQSGAPEAADRASSRSRVSTWTESSGSHIPINPPSQQVMAR